jgi:hypothetical protein
VTFLYCIFGCFIVLVYAFAMGFFCALAVAYLSRVVEKFDAWLEERDRRRRLAKEKAETAARKEAEQAEWDKAAKHAAKIRSIEAGTYADRIAPRPAGRL